MFDMSVVTRLLILPTRLSALEFASGFGSSEGFAGAFWSLLDPLDLTLEELDCRVSSGEFRVSTVLVKILR